MQDAYTTSRYFPYAQTLPGLELNYIRNAVKVVIDAYNGTVSFYVADSSDPIAATYQFGPGCAPRTGRLLAFDANRFVEEF
jgi:hypothetical protein